MQSREETTDLRVAVDLGPRSYEVRVVTGQSAGFGPFVRGRSHRDGRGDRADRR